MDQEKLLEACIKGDIKVVNKFVNPGMIAKLFKSHDIDMKLNDSGATALSAAACFGHTKIVQMLIGKGADVNHTSTSGTTPLMDASGKGHTEIVKIFIESGADINALDNNNETALFYTLDEDHLETAKFLIEAGVNINQSNKSSETAHTIAKSIENSSICNLLVGK